jgi:3-(3-hydroxy-phenyl)propionate hydroxylase
MPGGRRWEFLLRPDEVAEAERADWVRPLLRNSGWDPDQVTVTRSAVYRFSAGTADRWRDRRILLAGDAAHLMPPFAGQGLSAGLRDASALGWRLGLVLDGADSRVLDGYQRERHSHVRAMTRLALFVGGVVQTRHPLLARVRDGILRAADRSPGVGPWLRAGGPRPAARLPRPAGRVRARAEGLLLPAVSVRTSGGATVPLDALLGTGHALIAETDPFTGLPHSAQAAWKQLGVTRLMLAAEGDENEPADGCRVVSTTDARLRRLLRGGRVLVIRPDRYLLGAVRFPDLHTLTSRYAEQLGSA